MKNEKYFPQITDMASLRDKGQNAKGRKFCLSSKIKIFLLKEKEREAYALWKKNRDAKCLDDYDGYPSDGYPSDYDDGYPSDGYPSDYDEYPSDWEYDGWTSDCDGWKSDCDGWTSDCDGWTSKKDTNSNSRTVSPLSDDHSRGNYDDVWFYEECDSSQYCHIPNTPEEYVDEPIGELDNDDHKFFASSKYNMKKASKRGKAKRKKNSPKVRPARKNGRSYYE